MWLFECQEQPLNEQAWKLWLSSVCLHECRDWTHGLLPALTTHTGRESTHSHNCSLIHIIVNSSYKGNGSQACKVWLSTYKMPLTGRRRQRRGENSEKIVEQEHDVFFPPHSTETSLWSTDWHGSEPKDTCLWGHDTFLLLASASVF